MLAARIRPFGEGGRCSNIGMQLPLLRTLSLRHWIEADDPTNFVAAVCLALGIFKLFAICYGVNRRREGCYCRSEHHHYRRNQAKRTPPNAPSRPKVDAEFRPIRSLTSEDASSRSEITHADTSQTLFRQRVGTTCGKHPCVYVCVCVPGVRRLDVIQVDSAPALRRDWTEKRYTDRETLCAAALLPLSRSDSSRLGDWAQVRAGRSANSTLSRLRNQVCPNPSRASQYRTVQALPDPIFDDSPT